jgi:hypothetical protein
MLICEVLSRDFLVKVVIVVDGVSIFEIIAFGECLLEIL